METRLKEVLQGQEGNYIVPFFWQHGETEETLREYMGKIQESGIHAVCVESRPHPDYVGPGWWRDMDVILEEARARKMRVWVLDDAHFPTGYCNGQIASHPEHGKVFLDHYAIEAMGPDAHASFLVWLQEGEELVGVVAARYSGEEPGRHTDLVDLTACVREGIVYWAVPEGYWRIIVLKTVRKGKNCRQNYCNLLDREAVAFFLDTVYEPHWQHYREEFGNVFAGFFSDEPEFGNTFGEHPHTGIGQPAMLLPWSRELAECCGKAWGKEMYFCLAALWNDLEGYTQKARYGYMSMATDLYSRNFCMQVGKWCEDHGVEYIGHVVEDNGNHARTGYGTGHFFKSLWGQHMSGIDVVLQQIRPGFHDRDFYHIGGKNTYDGRFFHYGLGKMGSSLAHLDQKKKGRTICEVYGAYGWTEGLKLMKWIADHMLVRGVNWFVPHAFTPAHFPDPDCPPHFYAQGQNPQFPWFRDLMGYMNRMCHLFSGGRSVIHVAVLYTAEMGWMGDHMPFEEVGKRLLCSQIDFDVVPLWLLGESRFTVYNPGEETRQAGGGPAADGLAAYNPGEETGQADKRRGRAETRLCVGGTSYSVLIVPDCAYVPEALARWTRRAAQAGFPVLFMGERPKPVATGQMGMPESAAWEEETGRETSGVGPDERQRAWAEAKEWNVVTKKEAGPEESREATEAVGSFQCGRQEKLSACLEETGIREIRTEGQEPWLRYHQYRQPEGIFYMFFNEHPTKRTDTWIEVTELQGERERARQDTGSSQERMQGGWLDACWYDGWDNCLYHIEQNDQGQIRLLLSPYETKILCLGRPGRAFLSDTSWYRGSYPGEARRQHGQEEGCDRKYVELAGEWKVSFKAYDEPEFGSCQMWPSLENVTGPGQRPDFSGTVRYGISFEWNPEEDGTCAVLDCGQVYETLEVRLNGTRQAVRVAPPYICRLQGLRQGQNDLELLVSNTLVHKLRDMLSVTMPVEASGLLGPVRVEAEEYVKGVANMSSDRSSTCT